MTMDAARTIRFSLLAVLAASAILPGCSTSPAEWSRSDARWQKAVTASIFLDSLSTADAMRRGCNEDNPSLSRFPSDGELLLAAVVGSLLHYGVARYVKRPKWRRAWQVVFAIGHTGLAIHNSQIECRRVDVAR